MLKGKKIEPDKHLIIFDEVQECPEALNSLKYFCEKAREYHIISAGSLLGTLLAQPKSYPVGKVNIMNIYPLMFDEFLCAVDGGLFSYYESLSKGCQIENNCLQQLRDCFDILPQYFVQGQNSEIDFMLQNGMEIIPVEVKAGDSIHSNSFKKYIMERKPKIAIRFSGLGYKVQENIINIPLYLVKKSKLMIGEADT